MSEGSSGDGRGGAREANGREALRRELERSGVAAEIAERLAGDLETLSGSLTPEARLAALQGVALASAVHRERADAFRRSQEDLAEIERMMSAFASELKKVDEAVKILSTFVGRIRQQTTPVRGRVIH